MTTTEHPNPAIRPGRILDRAEANATLATAIELPLVVRHPRHDRPLLHLPRHPDSRIVGLGDDEGRELLATLWAIVERSPARFEHVASPGDLVIWDNIALLHTDPSAPRNKDRRVWFATIGEPVSSSRWAIRNRLVQANGGPASD